METASRWLSVEEIAEYLGVSKESIYRWLERGAIPAHKVGKQWRFQSPEVDDWVKRGEASENHRAKNETEKNSECEPLRAEGCK